MSNHIEAVKKYIKHDRSITAGKDLYNKLPRKSLALQNKFNRMSNTTANVTTLCYELCKAVGIDHRLYTVLMNQPVQPITLNPDAKEVKDINVTSDPINAQDKSPIDLALEVIATNVNDLSYPDLKKLVKYIRTQKPEFPAPKSQKKAVLIQWIYDVQAQSVEEVQKDMPNLALQGISIREQFPFLRDASCPDFLKVLVSDLITAYENYTAGHAKLWDKMTVEQEATLAQEIVENYIINKQAFAELEYYREHNTILGEHPAYRKQKMRNELEDLSTQDLTKKISSLRKNISSNRKKAEALNDGDEHLSVLSDRVADYEWQLEQVQEILKSR